MLILGGLGLQGLRGFVGLESLEEDPFRIWALG